MQPSSDSRIPLPTDPGVPGYGTDLDYAVARFASSAMRLRALDPVVTELVRLKCAEYHDCRQCKSLRLDEAMDAGVDEKMTAKVSRFESSDLDERYKVALRFTECMIIEPTSMTPALAAEIRTWYSKEEIVELTLDVMKWSQQKPQVSLKIEAPKQEGLTVMGFAENGDFVRGGLAAGSARA
ncbi:MAG: hypothetical protein JWQ64_1441 [Subtercola sp.]|nr:hypothetical protein [Subtercola sp.]